MSEGQRIIKYIAYALACFLIFSIISGIISILMGISFFYSNNNPRDIKDLNINEEYNNLDIEISSTNLIIKIKDEFKIQTSTNNINIKKKFDKLIIKENNYSWINKHNTKVLYIDIPKNKIMNNITIKTGAGQLSIEDIQTKSIKLDLGAGSININNLVVLDKTNIEGGAGKNIIKNSYLNNLDLNIGIGSLFLEGEILGSSNISQGIGEVKINLIGNSSKYKISIDKGLGTATIDGNKINDNTVIGNGTNNINIDNGIGNIKVTLLENNNK